MDWVAYMSADLITFIIAVLAGVVSIVGLVITKENKISEFRQLWINDLRNSLVKLSKNMFILQCMHAENAPRAGITNQSINVKESISEVYLRINKLNPNKEELKLIDVIEELDYFIGAYGNKDYNDLDKKLIHASASVLKSEWTRVKNGEKKYRFWTKLFTCMFFAVPFYLFIINLPDFIESVLNFFNLH